MSIYLRTLSNKIKTFLHNKEGVAALEFMLVIPVLLILFYGAMEISRYVLATQKLQKTASEIGNVVSQSTSTSSAPLNDALMSQLMSATQYMMYPYGNNTNLRVIVTDVKNTGTTATPAQTVQWQWCSSKSGAQLTGNINSRLTANCTYSIQGGVNSPKGCTLQSADFGAAGFDINSTSGFEAMTSPGDEVVVTEVYFQYSPIIANRSLVSGNALYIMASNYPRQGTNSTYSPTTTSCP